VRIPTRNRYRGYDSWVESLRVPDCSLGLSAAGPGSGPSALRLPGKKCGPAPEATAVNATSVVVQLPPAAAVTATLKAKCLMARDLRRASLDPGPRRRPGSCSRRPPGPDAVQQLLRLRFGRRSNERIDRRDQRRPARVQCGREFMLRRFSTGADDHTETVATSPYRRR
jgi:hypothetical protein